MATEAENLRPPPCPLSDLGPCELSWVHRSIGVLVSKNCWVFWSRYSDELRYHQWPLLLANGDTFNALASTTKEKIKCVLQGICPHFFCEAYLVQYWGLVNIGDSRYLTTCDQPFALSHWHLGNVEEAVDGLCRYRKHCLEYLIAVDETSVQEEEFGPPGRVFRSGLPEHVSDVSHYSRKEYPQHDPAVPYANYWALPIYQSPGRICTGVSEFVASSQGTPSMSWAPYLDLLKEVGLTTNYPVWLSDYKQSSSCHNREINTIAKVLKMIRKMHGIPVAQIWIEANSEEQLTAIFEGCCSRRYAIQFASRFYFIRKGHGIVGKAFSSKSACFCRDIRQLSITEYPLVPNARKYGLSSCFAICLQSYCLNSCIYILEFFLHTNKTNSRDPRILLLIIMETLKQHLQNSFKVAPGQELGQNLSVEVIKISSDDKFDYFEICHTTSGESTPKVVEVQNEVGMTPLDYSYQRVNAANNSVHTTNAQQNVIVGSPPTPKPVQNVVSITHRQLIEELDTAIPARNYASMEQSGNEVTNLRKRGSTYTLESKLQITLEVLQQRSAMKLVDAAKDLGVSRSTIKRICRRHDIHRWPPHKARKYNQAIDQQEFAQLSKKNSGTHSMSVATRLPDDSSIMVKANYGDVIIKFQLSLAARKMDLVEKVAMRLNLPVGSFKIMYLDEEDDWVSITCDEDLSMSLRMLRSVGKTTIRMLVSQ